MRKKDFLTSRRIAHRGIHYDYLENTLLSFQQAIRENKIIELDVHLTKDNVVIVFHDNSLKRIFNIERDLKELTLKEVKELKCIPTLEEVLKLVQGKVPILIELKFDRRVGMLEKATSKLLDHYAGEFAVQSFHPLSLFWFRLNRSHFIRGYLVNSFFPDNFLLQFFLNNRLLKKVLKPDFLAVNLTALKTDKIINLRKKYLVIGYTLKTREEYQKYFLYADNFICDITD